MFGWVKQGNAREHTFVLVLDGFARLRCGGILGKWPTEIKEMARGGRRIEWQGSSSDTRWSLQ